MHDFSKWSARGWALRRALRLAKPGRARGGLVLACLTPLFRGRAALSLPPSLSSSPSLSLSLSKSGAGHPPLELHAKANSATCAEPSIIAGTTYAEPFTFAGTTNAGPSTFCRDLQHSLMRAGREIEHTHRRGLKVYL